MTQNGGAFCFRLGSTGEAGLGPPSHGAPWARCFSPQESTSLCCSVLWVWSSLLSTSAACSEGLLIYVILTPSSLGKEF